MGHTKFPSFLPRDATCCDKTAKDTAILAMKCEQETVPKLSNGRPAVFNDLE